MFEKQIEKMLSQMSGAQKYQMETLLKDEESLKKILSGLDPEKVKKTAESLGISGVSKEKIGKMTEEIAKNPEKLQELGKKL